MIPTNPPRRHHRKRISAVNLSSDTTSTLPEYIPAGWHQRSEEHDPPSDKPPDYPDSAEEADADTNSESDSNIAVYVPHPTTSLPTSPRRLRRFPSHRRRKSSPTTSSNDPYLDSLLERSVHALEMSNALLQSSISTQTSLSAILASDSPVDTTLEARARGLSRRIRNNGNVHDTWADDLDEISRGVEGLFGHDERQRKISSHSTHSVEGSLSCSLPTSSSPSQLRANRRRPSLDLRKASNVENLPQLRLTPQDRNNLVAPPPRALTQYVASTSDPDSITLPSTLGLRSSSSSHLSDWRLLTSASETFLPSFHASASLPIVTDKPMEPSTPAYNMLSSFVYRAPSSGSSTPSSIASVRTSFMSRPRRGSSNASTSTERGGHSRTSPSPASSHKSPDRTLKDGPACRSRSLTPKQVATPSQPHRCMTPPIEELSGSSSSSDGCRAKRTVISLRKILDDQPLPPTTNGDAKDPPLSAPLPERARPPAFLPRSPAPLAEAGTSTATASISRLFTKATHSSSTRPPSPPKHSSMKQPSSSSTPPTPTPTPTTSSLSIPDIFNVAFGSGTSSGRSTPKRISFAELPESYASSRPEGAPSKFKDKKNRRRAKSRSMGGGEKDGARSWGWDKGGKGKLGDEEGIGGWFSGWLLSTSTAAGPGMSAVRNEDRGEERMGRNWGPRMGIGGGLDDWAM